MLLPQETIIAFVLTSIVACLIPGPAVLFVVTQTASRGLRSGLSAVWGLQLGFLIQVLAATCGLSALILKSAVAFSILKFLGALYLIYLGLVLLTHKNDRDEIISPSFGLKSISSFGQGVLVNVLNPKIAIFFLSYVPQFVASNRGSLIGQVFFFGMLFCVLGTLTNIAYAISVKKTAQRFGRLLRSSVFRRWLPGSIFLGFGVKLALSDRY